MTYHRVTLAALALTLMLATLAPATAQDTGFGASIPETRYFRVDSTVAAGRRGPQVEGYVYNVHDIGAMRMRIRVQALDAGGRPLDTRDIWVPGDVPPHSRAFFSVHVPPNTASARVTILSLDWMPRGGGM